VTKNPSLARDENNLQLEPPRYPLCSDPQATLLSPLHTPSRRCRNNLVSNIDTGTSVTMSTPDNWSPDASTDSRKQADLANTLNSIMAQLTLIGNRLNLQGATLTHHTQLLDGTEDSLHRSATQAPRATVASTTARAQAVASGVLLTNHSGPTTTATITPTSATPSTGPSSAFLATTAPPITCHG
jgi:hypothetical protein